MFYSHVGALITSSHMSCAGHNYKSGVISGEHLGAGISWLESGMCVCEADSAFISWLLKWGQTTSVF